LKNDSLNADNTTTKIDSLWANQQKIIPIPPLSALKLHGDNCGGFRACHTCRGTRFVYIRSKWDNRITYKKCMACSGSGSIDTRTLN
jgi:hypothetical protein